MFRFRSPTATHLLFFLLSLAGVATGCARSAGNDSDPLPNVRLGMSPRDVRDRFVLGHDGNWQTVVTADNDTALEWTGARDHDGEHARFEFHLGMLVAIRAHLRDATPSEEVGTTAKTVTLRRPSEGGTDVTILARDCPTHHEEAESIARLARR